MNKIQRWEAKWNGVLQAQPDGVFVRYADHCAVLAEIRERLLSDEACRAGALALRPDAEGDGLDADIIEVRKEVEAALDAALGEQHDPIPRRLHRLPFGRFVRGRHLRLHGPDEPMTNHPVEAQRQGEWPDFHITWSEDLRMWVFAGIEDGPSEHYVPISKLREAEAACDRFKAALVRLQMGPDTLTQDGLRIVLDALYPAAKQQRGEG